MLQKFFMAVLAGAALLAAAPVVSHDDDDDDDWKERRRYYHYERPPIVIYRDPPAPPRGYRDRPAAPSPQEPAVKTPRSFPRESPADRAAAKERQRDILQKELAAEQALLDSARRERAEPSKDSIETHERNIEALKRELSNLNR